MTGSGAGAPPRDLGKVQRGILISSETPGTRFATKWTPGPLLGDRTVKSKLESKLESFFFFPKSEGADALWTCAHLNNFSSNHRRPERRPSATWQPCIVASWQQNRGARLRRTYWLLGKNSGSLLERPSRQEASPLPAQEFTAKSDLTSCPSSYSKLSLGLNPVASLHTYAILPDSWPWASLGSFTTGSSTKCLFPRPPPQASNVPHPGSYYILSCLQTPSDKLRGCKAMLGNLGSVR